MKHLVVCLVILLLTRDGSAAESKPVKVELAGDSVLNGVARGQAVRVVISTYKRDVGRPGEPAPRVRRTNCTYSRYPCSQVNNLRIWVNGKELFLSRSLFADLADVGTMVLTSDAGVNLLTLVGGDASESYTVKVYFDADRVEKREVYSNEAGSLSETTTYAPPAALD